MALFPTFDTPQIIDAKKEPVAVYKESVYFDVSKGDIVVDGSGKCKIADPCEAWLQWCMKMIFTEMNACLAYPGEIGVEMEYAMSRDDREAKEIAIENTIIAALMNDPSHRTIEVSEFSFVHNTDSVVVKFQIVGADGYTGRLSVEIGGE